LFNTNSLISYKLKIFYKFKIINKYYLTRFLNPSIKDGKKWRFYKLYFNYYQSLLLNFMYFYRKPNSNIIKIRNNKPFFLKFKEHNTKPTKQLTDLFSFFFYQNKLFFLMDYTIMNFFKHNTFILSFFVEKRKTFINHKKKFLDKIVFVFVSEKNKKFIFFKFLKTLFLKKKYKKTMLNLYNYNLLQYSDSVYKSIFESLIFEINTKQKKN